MNFKRIFAFILVLMMTMTMLAGCGSKVEEEAGMVGEYVEGEEQEITGDKPEKGEESEIIESDDPQDSGKDEKPSDKEEQKPSNQEGQNSTDQGEEKEEQNSSDKEEQNSSDKNQQTQKPNNQTQKPNNQTQKPNNNQQTQQPNNNQQVQTPSQDEFEEDEFEEDEFEDEEYEDDEDYTDEDEDGEWDGGSYPSGGTPVQKPNLSDQDIQIANTLKIVAYNVRMKNDGNGNDIADRQPRFKAMVEEYQPDIMGLSEANEPWIKYLESSIVGSKYQMIYTYRAPNSKEAQPILYDKTKFDVMDFGYFWLSETPDEASKGWGGEYYRGATWAKLKVKLTGKTFLYYSTHLTGSDAIAVPSAKLIYNHAADQRGFSTYPVFVSGDFNFKTDSAGYKEITKYFVDVNNHLGFDPTYTFMNNYDPAQGGKLIDYVMCSPDNVTPKKYQVIEKKYLGGYVSDHRGIYVEALLK